MDTGGSDAPVLSNRPVSSDAPGSRVAPTRPVRPTGPFHPTRLFPTRPFGGGRSFPAHELREERDLVSRPEGGVEGVLDAEHRIVDEQLDVLAQLLAVPEDPLELREPRREALEHTPDRRARHQRLVHDAPARA